MSEVIKGSNPAANIVIEGSVPINNRLSFPRSKNPEAQEEKPKEEKNEAVGEEAAEDNTVKVDYEELEALREQYRSEGEAYAKNLQARAEAEYAQATEKAGKLLENIKEQESLMLKEMERKAEAAVEEGRKQGAEAGYAEGMKKGEEEGYIQGLKKCKDTLLDLKKLCEDIEREKSEIFAENRRGVFDLAMSVAEKITLTTFAQKDKRALEKMITAAAKEFRSAKSVRVSLSRLDLGEDLEADFRLLEKCFSPTVNVEFEAIDGAESGTILLESDSEILDTSVSTQLKMINELGRGKFREKEEDSSQEYEEDAEQPKPKEKNRQRAKAKAKAEPVSAALETVDDAVTASETDEGALSASLTEAAGVDEALTAVSAEVNAAEEAVTASVNDLADTDEGALAASLTEGAGVDEALTAASAEVNAAEEAVTASVTDLADTDEGALTASLKEAAGIDEATAASTADETITEEPQSAVSEENTEMRAAEDNIAVPETAENIIASALETSEDSTVLENSAAENTETLSAADLAAENNGVTELTGISESLEILADNAEMTADNTETNTEANTAEKTDLTEGAKEKPAKKKSAKSSSRKNAEKADADDIITLTKSAVQQTLDEMTEDEE